MGPRTARSRSSRPFLPWATLGCALGLLSAGAGFFGLPFPGIQAETEPEEGDATFLVICGPNDGEPINSRFKVESNYRESGVIDVAINDAYLYTRPLHESGYWTDKGVYRTHVTVDMVQAGRYLGQDLLHPDAGPIRLKIKLFSSGNRFITSYLWTGYVGKPWIEFLPKPVTPTPGVSSARVVLHPLHRDAFYLLLASPQRDTLASATPDNPRLLRESKILAAGPCVSGAPLSQVSLEPLYTMGWQQNYMVLWTYSAQGTWRRSVIQQVVR